MFGFVVTQSNELHKLSKHSASSIINTKEKLIIDHNMVLIVHVITELDIHNVQLFINFSATVDFKDYLYITAEETAAFTFLDVHKCTANRYKDRNRNQATRQEFNL